MTTSTAIIKPLGSVQLPPIRLSINDLLMPEYYLHILYYYQRPASGDGEAAAAAWDEAMSPAALRAALQGLLSVYPVLGGRLRPIEGTVDREIHADSEIDPEFGIPFHEAEINLDFASLRAGGFRLSDADEAALRTGNIWDLLALPRPPLLTAKLTRFPCGSVCLAIAWHHLVADAAGIVDAINAWGEIAREITPAKPELDRVRFIRPSAGVERLPVPVVEGKGEAMVIPVTVNQAILIAPEKLRRLKQDATGTEARGEGDVGWVSNNDAATALLWRAMARARHLPSGRDENSFIECGFALNMRKRPHIGLVPDTFYGNATIVPVTRFSFADLTRGLSLAHVARLIHRAINDTDTAFTQRAIDFSHRHMGHFWHLFGMEGPPGSAMVNVSSWYKFPLYGLDFGVGQPVHVGVPHFPGADGVALLLPSNGGSTEGMVIHCMIKEDARSKLAEDEELLRYAELL